MNFVLNLEYPSYVPLFRRLSDALRKAILDGRLKPGEAMPSVRDLSTTMDIARATVLKAFADLQEQGYLESRKGQGSFVSRTLPGDLADVGPAARTPDEERLERLQELDLSSYGRRVLTGSMKDIEYSAQIPDINYGGPPMEVAPLATWKRLLQEHCRFQELDRLSTCIEPFGYLPLREAVAAYLHRFRAVRTDAERVAMFATKQLRLDAIARLLLDPGDLVAFEEPGFPEARMQLASHGAELVPIRVDKNGLDVADLESRQEKFRLIYVTPSHQDPTGAVMSLERRKRLLDFAACTGAFIVEDDYDCEFRYGGTALPSLQGLDRNDCVIYLGSFWKVLFPVVRFGYVVVPQCLQTGLFVAKMQLERKLPVLEQLALTDFINQGFLERHIKKTRAIYAKRRQAMIYAVTKHLGKEAIAESGTGGTHVVLSIDSGISQSDVLSCAKSAELPMISMDAYCSEATNTGNFILSFSGLDPSGIEAQIKRFAALVQAAGSDVKCR